MKCQMSVDRIRALERGWSDLHSMWKLSVSDWLSQSSPFYKSFIAIFLCWIWSGTELMKYVNCDVSVKICVLLILIAF